MSNVYVKRGSICQAEPFDPTRTDQGVTVNTDSDGNVLSTTISSFGRLTNVRPGDMIVTDDRGGWCCSAASFAGLYQLLSDVVAPDNASISETGGNQ